MPLIYGRIRRKNLPISKNWCVKMTIDKQIVTSRLDILHCGILQCYRFWLQMRISPLASAHSLAQLHNRLRVIWPYLHCPTLRATPRHDPCQTAFEALVEEALVMSFKMSCPDIHCVPCAIFPLPCTIPGPLGILTSPAAFPTITS